MKQEFQKPQYQPHKTQKHAQQGQDHGLGSAFDAAINYSNQFFSVPQPQKLGGDLEVRAPEMGEDRRRLLVAVSNNQTGNAFLDSLRENQHRLGFVFAGTLEDLLIAAKVDNAKLAREMTDNFAFIDILPGMDFPVMNGILRHGCSVAPPLKLMADVDVEPDAPMLFSQTTGLGPNYTLRSHGSMHDTYLKMLNTSAAPSNGTGYSVAVVDSGVEKPGIASGFLDIVEPGNTTEKDKFGHGTAMASIVADVARGAKVFSVRASDKGPDISEAILGISGGHFHFKPDIINLSFGLPQGQTCQACGSSSKVTRVFHRFLRSISQLPAAAGGPPLLVAAVGNKGVATGFDVPAIWNYTLAVGSIDSNRNRSSFSNYGSPSQLQYVMMPGGAESQGAVTEWVGEAAQKCYGTSVAAAYASGILALYMSDPRYQGINRSAFLSTVLSNCKPCNNQNSLEHGLGYRDYI